MNKFLIILAGGVGKRFNENIPKQYYVDRNGASILKKSVLPFNNKGFKKVIIVCDLQYKEMIIKELDFLKIELIFTSGGSNRMDSLIKGLNIVKDEQNGFVFIQESVRPYVSERIVDDLINAPKEWVAVSPSVSPPVLYGKLNLKDNTSTKLYKKTRMVEFQSPKRYKISVLLDCISNSDTNTSVILDESEYIIKNDYPINLIKGSYDNIKITLPFHKKNI